MPVLDWAAGAYSGRSDGGAWPFVTRMWFILRSFRHIFAPRRPATQMGNGLD